MPNFALILLDRLWNGTDRGRGGRGGWDVECICVCVCDMSSLPSGANPIKLRGLGAA